MRWLLINRSLLGASRTGECIVNRVYQQFRSYGIAGPVVLAQVPVLLDMQPAGIREIRSAVLAGVCLTVDVPSQRVRRTAKSFVCVTMGGGSGVGSGFFVAAAATD